MALKALIPAVLVAGVAFPAAAQPLILARNGRTAYVIAVAADAIPAEKTAAEELKKHLESVTDADFPIVAETAVTAERPQIVVGSGPRAHQLVPAVDWRRVGPDGVVIKTAGQSLVLAGDRPRGTLYAVYEFLERAAGCRWWTPTESTIPHRAELKVEPQNTLYTPPFAYREHFTSSVREDPFFATRMRENGSFQTQSEAWGGHAQILGWCHTFSQLLPPSKYFKAHPEWYSDPTNGYRPCTAASPQPNPGETQLCLTNDAAREEITQQALLWIRQHPEAPYISISQNDNHLAFCTCPNCTRLKEAEGAQSGPLLHFVNGVAEAIGRDYPNILVETLAYQPTEKAPRTIRPARNVLIRFAPIDKDFGHPLDSEWNAESRQNLQAWSKIAPHLFVWNYVTNFQNYALPHPNWLALGPDLRSFAAHGVTGIYEQGDPYSKTTGDYLQLRAWLMAKLMWDPSQDQSRLTDEFLAGYYGAAAPFLRQDLDLVQQAFLAQKRPLGQTNQDYSFLTVEVLNQRTRLLDAAEKAVQGQAELTRRVQRLKLPLQLCWLSRYQKLADDAAQAKLPFLGSSDPLQTLVSFPQTAAALGEPVFSPGGAFQTLIPRLKESFAPKVALPDFARNLPPGDVIDIQQGRFYLYRKNELSFVVPDAAASDGQAASVLGDTETWAAQAWMSEVFEGTEGGLWHVYALARAIPKPGGAVTGTGFRTGVYDGGSRKSLTEFNVPLEQVVGDQFVRVDLGVQPLNSKSYIWFAPQRNSSVAEIRVDRVILVREK